MFGSKGHTVQLKENWGFLLKICPPLPKVRLRLWNVISNTFFDFGFGTIKEAHGWNLAVCDVVYRYRQIKLMSSVQ